ncbi:MAG: DNA polymerase IV [Bacteroidales bacterium]|nr:DNA polymerase IV [Bacteroidales bacterium]MBN2818147.1 DNA polymerase IV [Bacteroidales bacterium]
MRVRKIIHIDMDAFYASIEQRDNPLLRGKPVAVGGSRNRGVVAAASYEARKFGVFSAMPSLVAKRKCPKIIFVKPRFDVYQKVSGQIQEIFHEYTDLVEPLSLDEAFLDVTENKPGIKLATDIAKEIKFRIKEETGLTASAGVSFNKFLAKIASDYDKPDGLYVIKPKMAESFIEKLPVRKFFGVGAVTAEKMHKIGIATGKDLKQWSLDALVRNFGKSGHFFYNIARGTDNRPVNPSRIRKSIGAEHTYDIDLQGKNEILDALAIIGKELNNRLSIKQRKGRTLTLKVKFDNFEKITRSKSLEDYLSPSNINDIMHQLIDELDFSNRGVRLLGLTISNLDKPSHEVVQLEIPYEYNK